MSVGILNTKQLEEITQAVIRATDQRQLGQVWLITQEAYKVSTESQIRSAFLTTFIEEALRSQAEEDFDRVKWLLDTLCNHVLCGMLSKLIVEAFVAAGIDVTPATKG